MTSQEPPENGRVPESHALAGRAGYLLIKLGEVILERAEHALAPHHLRARQFNVLSMIAADPALSQRAVSGALGLDATTMVTLIDDLERQALVHRERDPSDRRRYCLQVTTTGQRTLRRALDAIEDAQRELFEPLTVDETATLQELAGRVLAPLWPTNPT